MPCQLLKSQDGHWGWREKEMVMWVVTDWCQHLPLLAILWSYFQVVSGNCTIQMVDAVYSGSLNDIDFFNIILLKRCRDVVEI